MLLPEKEAQVEPKNIYTGSHRLIGVACHLTEEGATGTPTKEPVIPWGAREIDGKYFLAVVLLNHDRYGTESRLCSRGMVSSDSLIPIQTGSLEAQKVFRLLLGSVS